MKIRTKLKLNTWISVGAIIFMLFVLAWSFWETYRTNRNELLADQLRKTTVERILLRDEYLLYQEKRARVQWYAKSEVLRGLLEAAAERFTSKEEKVLLQEARKNFDMTSSLFSTMLQKHMREKHAAKKYLPFNEAESRLINQLFLKAYALMDNIDKLHESSLTAAKTARNRGVVLIIIFIVGGIMTIVINSVLLNKIVAKQVASLAEGIRIIGGGNLDYRIDATGNDELSGLARASNEMVAKLKQSYISMEKLQQEITGRKETEEELRESEEHYRTLFNESLDGLCLADAETGIIIDCNKALAALVCRERAELIGQPQTILHPPRDDKEAFSLTFKKHLTDKEGQILETQVVTRTGDIREVEIKANFVVLQDRKMLQGLFHDITERKLAESQRKAALEEIKSLSEELEQRVIDRTAELTAKTAEMERINKVFVDRELRMRELKARIAELEKKT